MSEILYHTKFLDLKSTISKNGNPWVYAHRPNASDVVIILTMTEEEVLFVVEERPPIQAEHKGKYTVGLVAGLVGDERLDETLEDAIKAELLEEAGLLANDIQIVAYKVASSAGCVSETSAIAIAKVLDKNPIQQPVDDDGVIVDRVWVKKSEVHKWLNEKEKEGCVLTAQALAALFYLNRKDI